MGGLNLAVGHLNASVGPLLTVEQLAAAMRAGSTRHLPETPAALVLSMFAELSPALILRCAAEAGADVRQVDQLYREALADALPPVPAWEHAIRPKGGLH